MQNILSAVVIFLFLSAPSSLLAGEDFVAEVVMVKGKATARLPVKSRPIHR